MHRIHPDTFIGFSTICSYFIANSSAFLIKLSLGGMIGAAFYAFVVPKRPKEFACKPAVLSITIWAIAVVIIDFAARWIAS